MLCFLKKDWPIPGDSSVQKSLSWHSEWNLAFAIPKPVLIKGLLLVACDNFKDLVTMFSSWFQWDLNSWDVTNPKALEDAWSSYPTESSVDLVDIVSQQRSLRPLPCTTDCTGNLEAWQRCTHCTLPPNAEFPCIGLSTDLSNQDVQ